MSMMKAESKISTRGASLRLFMASVLLMYAEVMLIRWLGSEIRMFAYLKNFALFAAFLGLGLGMTGRFPHVTKWHFPLTAVLLLLLAFSAELHLTRLFFPDAGVHQWGGSIAAPQLAASIRDTFLGGHGAAIPEKLMIAAAGVLSAALFAALFFLTLVIFIPLGRYVGEGMKNVQPSLKAYTLNLAGSLAGTLLFTLLVSFYLPPWIWLVPFLLMMMMFSGNKIRDAFLSLLMMGGIFYSGMSQADVYWSPYYRVSLLRLADAATLLVDHDGFQEAVSLTPGSVSSQPALEPTARYYNFFYRDGEKPGRVLVMGAGMGNDVAAALRAGAERVDAVEIDPLIQKLGMTDHPEKPYDSPRVFPYINDARAFLRQASLDGARYDRIVLGLVDSHAAFAAMSSLRLELYLYSRESMAQTLSLLDQEKGVLMVGFGVSWKEWVAERIYKTLWEAGGEPPLVLKTSPYLGAYTFVAGPGKEKFRRIAAQDPSIEDLSARYAGSKARPVTDDWPFLYFNPEKLPVIYFSALLFVLVSGIALVCRPSSDGRRISRMDTVMFLMGAGFLLMEAKNISQLSLLFGGTWVVNTVVFSSIFIMALAANFFVARGVLRLNYAALYALLGLSLLLNYLMPAEAVAHFKPLLRAAAAGIPACLPVIFSSLIFSRLFENIKNPDRALAANLIGGVSGGVLEALCVFTGMRFIVLVALAIYALSYALVRKGLSGSEV